MKKYICERCFDEYPVEEMSDNYGRTLCIPCQHEYKRKLKEFRLDFFNNQPERSKREDSIPEYGDKAPLNYDEWEKRCGALNSMET